MDLVQLKNGSIEIIGSHRDLVDIVEAGCGYEVAKKVENLDPAEFDDVYNAYENIMGASDLLNKDKYEENNIECAKILIDKAIRLLGSIL